MTRPLVSLTTDFGLADPSVGICRGVILSIAPDAQIVDVSHLVPRQSVAQGATLLASALPYLPVGVHMAVVDPGVGTERRAIALQCRRGDRLVGPDNGLLIPAAEVLGGAIACHELADVRYRRSPVSRTFHGRDIFSPAAGHLAAGVALAAFGPELDPAALVRVELPAARAEDRALAAMVVAIDVFGNAQLLAGEAELEAAVGPLEPGLRLGVSTAGARVASAVWGRTYGEVAQGDAVVLVDSFGRIAIAINMGNAASDLGLAAGIWVRIAKE